MASRRVSKNTSFAKKDVEENKSKEEIKAKNIEGKAFLYMARLAPGFNPERSPKAKEWAKAEIGRIWEDFGIVEDVNFKKNNNNGRVYYSAYVLFEEGLSEKIKKRLRKKGKVSLRRPLRVQRGWDYSRGDPLTEWRYDVFPCQFPYLTEEQRRQRYKERREKQNKIFLIDSDSDSDSDDDE